MEFINSELESRDSGGGDVGGGENVCVVFNWGCKCFFGGGLLVVLRGVWIGLSIIVVKDTMPLNVNA